MAVYQLRGLVNMYERYLTPERIRVCDNLIEGIRTGGISKQTYDQLFDKILEQRNYILEMIDDEIYCLNCGEHITFEHRPNCWRHEHPLIITPKPRNLP